MPRLSHAPATSLFAKQASIVDTDMDPTASGQPESLSAFGERTNSSDNKPGSGSEAPARYAAAGVLASAALRDALVQAPAQRAGAVSASWLPALAHCALHEEPKIAVAAWRALREALLGAHGKPVPLPSRKVTLRVHEDNGVTSEVRTVYSDADSAGVVDWLLHCVSAGLAPGVEADLQWAQDMLEAEQSRAVTADATAWECLRADYWATHVPAGHIQALRASQACFCLRALLEQPAWHAQVQQSLAQHLQAALDHDSASGSQASMDGECTAEADLAEQCSDSQRSLKALAALAVLGGLNRAVYPGAVVHLLHLQAQHKLGKLADSGEPSAAPSLCLGVIESLSSQHDDAPSAPMAQLSSSLSSLLASGMLHDASLVLRAAEHAQSKAAASGREVTVRLLDDLDGPAQHVPAGILRAVDEVQCDPSVWGVALQHIVADCAARWGLTGLTVPPSSSPAHGGLATLATPAADAKDLSTGGLQLDLDRMAERQLLQRPDGSELELALVPCAQQWDVDAAVGMHLGDSPEGGVMITPVQQRQRGGYVMPMASPLRAGVWVWEVELVKDEANSETVAFGAVSQPAPSVYTEPRAYSVRAFNGDVHVNGTKNPSWAAGAGSMQDLLQKFLGSDARPSERRVGPANAARAVHPGDIVRFVFDCDARRAGMSVWRCGASLRSESQAAMKVLQCPAGQGVSTVLRMHGHEAAAAGLQDSDSRVPGSILSGFEASTVPFGGKSGWYDVGEVFRWDDDVDIFPACFAYGSTNAVRSRGLARLQVAACMPAQDAVPPPPAAASLGLHRSQSVASAMVRALRPATDSGVPLALAESSLRALQVCLLDRKAATALLSDALGSEATAQRLRRQLLAWALADTPTCGAVAREQWSSASRRAAELVLQLLAADAGRVVSATHMDHMAAAQSAAGIAATVTDLSRHVKERTASQADASSEGSRTRGSARRLTKTKASTSPSSARTTTPAPQQPAASAAPAVPVTEQGVAQTSRLSEERTGRVSLAAPAIPAPTLRGTIAPGSARTPAAQPAETRFAGQPQQQQQQQQQQVAGAAGGGAMSPFETALQGVNSGMTDALVEMGFPERSARAALLVSSGNVVQAADLLTSNSEAALMALVRAAVGSSPDRAPPASAEGARGGTVGSQATPGPTPIAQGSMDDDLSDDSVDGGMVSDDVDGGHLEEEVGEAAAEASRRFFHDTRPGGGGTGGGDSGGGGGRMWGGLRGSRARRSGQSPSDPVVLEASEHDLSVLDSQHNTHAALAALQSALQQHAPRSFTLRPTQSMDAAVVGALGHWRFLASVGAGLACRDIVFLLLAHVAAGLLKGTPSEPAALLHVVRDGPSALPAEDCPVWCTPAGSARRDERAQQQQQAPGLTRSPSPAVDGARKAESALVLLLKCALVRPYTPVWLELVRGQQQFSSALVLSGLHIGARADATLGHMLQGFIREHLQTDVQALASGASSGLLAHALVHAVELELRAAAAQDRASAAGGLKAVRKSHAQDKAWLSDQELTASYNSHYLNTLNLALLQVVREVISKCTASQEASSMAAPPVPGTVITERNWSAVSAGSSSQRVTLPVAHGAAELLDQLYHAWCSGLHSPFVQLKRVTFSCLSGILESARTLVQVAPAVSIPWSKFVQAVPAARIEALAARRLDLELEDWPRASRYLQCLVEFASMLRFATEQAAAEAQWQSSELGASSVAHGSVTDERGGDGSTVPGFAGDAPLSPPARPLAAMDGVAPPQLTLAPAVPPPAPAQSPQLPDRAISTSGYGAHTQPKSSQACLRLRGGPSYVSLQNVKGGVPEITCPWTVEVWVKRTAGSREQFEVRSSPLPAAGSAVERSVEASTLSAAPPRALFGVDTAASTPAPMPMPAAAQSLGTPITFGEEPQCDSSGSDEGEEELQRAGLLGQMPAGAWSGLGDGSDGSEGSDGSSDSPGSSDFVRRSPQWTSDTDRQVAGLPPSLSSAMAPEAPCDIDEASLRLAMQLQAEEMGRGTPLAPPRPFGAAAGEQPGDDGPGQFAFSIPDSSMLQFARGTDSDMRGISRARLPHLLGRPEPGERRRVAGERRASPDENESEDLAQGLSFFTPSGTANLQQLQPEQAARVGNTPTPFGSGLFARAVRSGQRSALSQAASGGPGSAFPSSAAPADEAHAGVSVRLAGLPKVLWAGRDGAAILLECGAAGNPEAPRSLGIALPGLLRNASAASHASAVRALRSTLAKPAGRELIKSFSYDVPADKWVHLAFVADDKQVKLLVNGQEVSYVKVPGMAMPTATLGSQLHAARALLAEARLWHGAKTAEEVSRDMRRAVPLNPRPRTLAAYFRLDEGMGKYIADATYQLTQCFAHGTSWSEPGAAPDLEQGSDSSKLFSQALQPVAERSGEAASATPSAMPQAGADLPDDQDDWNEFTGVMTLPAVSEVGGEWLEPRRVAVTVSWQELPQEACSPERALAVWNEVCTTWHDSMSTAAKSEAARGRDAEAAELVATGRAVFVAGEAEVPELDVRCPVLGVFSADESWKPTRQCPRPDPLRTPGRVALFARGVTQGPPDSLGWLGAARFAGKSSGERVSGKWSSLLCRAPATPLRPGEMQLCPGLCGPRVAAAGSRLAGASEMQWGIGIAAVGIPAAANGGSTEASAPRVLARGDPTAKRQSEQLWKAVYKHAFTTGTWTWQVRCEDLQGVQAVGVIAYGASLNCSPGRTSESVGYSSDGKLYSGGNERSFGQSWGVGDVITCTLSLSGKKLDFFKNGLHQGQVSLSAELLAHECPGVLPLLACRGSGGALVAQGLVQGQLHLRWADGDRTVRSMQGPMLNGQFHGQCVYTRETPALAGTWRGVFEFNKPVGVHQRTLDQGRGAGVQLSASPAPEGEAASVPELQYYDVDDGRAEPTLAAGATEASFNEAQAARSQPLQQAIAAAQQEAERAAPVKHVLQSNWEVDRSKLFVWTPSSAGSAVTVSGDLQTVAYSGSGSPGIVLGSRGFSSGVHYWEVWLKSENFEQHMGLMENSGSAMIFIGVAEAHSSEAHANSFRDYGFLNYMAVTSGHTGERLYGQHFLPGDRIGVRLDMDSGTLSFTRDGQAFGEYKYDDYGTAFRYVRSGRAGGPGSRLLYPCVGLRRPADPVTIESSKWLSMPGRPPMGRLASVLQAATLLQRWDRPATRPVRLPRAFLQEAWRSAARKASGALVQAATRVGVPVQFNRTGGAAARVLEAAGCHIQLRAGDVVRWQGRRCVVLGVHRDRLWWRPESSAMGAWYWEGRELQDAMMAGEAELLPRPAAVQAEADAEAGQDAVADVAWCTGEPYMAPNAWSWADFMAAATDARWTLPAEEALTRLVNVQCDDLGVHPDNLLLQPVTEEMANAARLPAWMREADVLPQLRARFAVLQTLNSRLESLLPLVDLTMSRSQLCTSRGSQLQLPSALGRRLSRLRGLAFTRTKSAFWKAVLDATVLYTEPASENFMRPSSVPELSVNALRARLPRLWKQANPSARLSTSVFGQLMRATSDWHASAWRRNYAYEQDAGQQRNFFVKLEGEGVDDNGGPYRAVLAAAVAEEAAGPLGLWMPCANALRGEGSHREAHVVPADTMGELPAEPGQASGLPSPPDAKRDQLRFLGVLLGTAVRHDVLADVELANSVLRPLVGQPVREEDVASLDVRIAMGIAQLRAEAEGAGAVVEAATQLLESARAAVYAATTASGPAKSLPGASSEGELAGSHAETWFGRAEAMLPSLRCKTDTEQFIHYIVEALACSSELNMRALIGGLKCVLPVDLLPLWTEEELAAMFSGVNTVSVDVLKAVVKYGTGASAQSPTVQLLWEILEEFSPAQRRAFLNFVWARTRLPPSPDGFSMPFTIELLPEAKAAAGALPKSATCFFRLSLPPYVDKDTLREKLEFAVEHAATMDADWKVRSDATIEGFDDL